jgi:hypothetical protein
MALKVLQQTSAGVDKIQYLEANNLITAGKFVSDSSGVAGVNGTGQ